MVSARLGLERAKAQAEALQQLGLPAFVLSENGRLITAKRLGEELVPRVLQDRTSRLALVDKAADGLLKTAMEALKGGRNAPQSLPLRSMGDSPAVIHLLPIRRSAHDIFVAASVILVITPLVHGPTPSEAILQGLFDLTPAEARVARAIASAATVEEIAVRHGTSPKTVRAQLQQVMLKTGINRQAEIASLLSGVKTY
jgi:DNA-binding CsgD family transcriptional regulator